MNEVFSHPWATVSVATAAVVNPVWIDQISSILSILLQIGGLVVLGIQGYYLLKNKGTK